MSLKDHKDFWSTVVSIIAICSTIIGGSYTAIKFWQDSNAERLKQTQDASVERVKQTLVLLDRYQKSPIHEVRIKLENIWTNLEELIDTKANGDKKEFEQFILKVVGDNKLGVDIFLLVNFFETVQTCIDLKICDENSAKSFFCKDAVAIFHLHYLYIAHVRNISKDPSVGKLLEKFSKITCIAYAPL